MIVLGTDMHKGSHTLAAVVARTGEMLGDKTIDVGAGGFAGALDWARSLGDERVWALEDCRQSPVPLSGFCSVGGSASFALPRSWWLRSAAAHGSAASLT